MQLSLSTLSVSFLLLNSVMASSHAIGNGIQLNLFSLSNAQECTPSTVTWGYETTDGSPLLSTTATISISILDSTSAGITSQKRDNQHLQPNRMTVQKRLKNHSNILKRQSERIVRSIGQVAVVDGVFSWPQANVPSGSYVLVAQIDGYNSFATSNVFWVSRGDDSCVVADDGSSLSSAYDGASSSSSGNYDDGSYNGESSLYESQSVVESSTSIQDSTPTSSIASLLPSSSTSSSDDGDRQDSSTTSTSHVHHPHKGISSGGIAAAVIVPIFLTILAAYVFYRREKKSKSNGNGYSAFQNLKNRFSGHGNDSSPPDYVREKPMTTEKWTEFSGEDLNGPRPLSVSSTTNNPLNQSISFALPNSNSNDQGIERLAPVYQQPNRHLSALTEATEDSYDPTVRSQGGQRIGSSSDLYYLGTGNLTGGSGFGKGHASFAPSTNAPSTIDGQIGAPYGYGGVVDRELDGRRWSDQGEEAQEIKNIGGATGLKRSESSSSTFSIKRKPVPGTALVGSKVRFNDSDDTGSGNSSDQEHSSGRGIDRIQAVQDGSDEELQDNLSPLETSFSSLNSVLPLNINQNPNGQLRSSKFQSTWSSSTPGENRISDTPSISSSTARRERDDAFAEAYSEAVQEIEKMKTPEMNQSPFDDSNRVENLTPIAMGRDLVQPPSTPRVLLPSSPSLTATPDGSAMSGLSPRNYLRNQDQRLNRGNGDDENPPTLSVNLGEDKGFRISF